MVDAETDSDKGDRGLVRVETLFLSRAGADRALADQIGACLVNAGYRVFYQADFGNRNFVDAIDSALRSRTRVVALLSDAYQESEYCSAEWQNAIAEDPLNRNGRLIVLRVADCRPRGLLAGIAYWDLLPALNDAAKRDQLVLRAIKGNESPERDLPGLIPATPLPSGTVTFLSGDVEGSLQRWEQHPEAMSEATRRLKEVVQGAIHQKRGRVFVSQGCAIRAAFVRAEDAVFVALDVHRALAKADFSDVDGLFWRSAITTGSADLHDGMYLGAAYQRSVSLEQIACGDQILISSATAELVSRALPDGVSLRDLGAHRLMDITAPERVLQLVAGDIRSSFPSLRTIDEVPNNLPLQPTPLVGRAEVVADVSKLIESHRLVTLVGVGGIGKTRVALEVATDAQVMAQDGGVWFIDLAPLTGEGLVVGAIASALALRESSTEQLIETLLRRLKERSTLLILDNCEHLIGEVAALAERLVRQSPLLHVLATSQQALNVAGEQVYRVPPLQVPPLGEISAAVALQYGGVSWFVERAKLVDSSFQLTESNVQPIIEICRRLDGLALAIELAAARVNVLGPVELAQRLEQRLQIFTSASRDALPRHKTLRALINWSFNLLSASEQTVFARLAIFTGGCTLEAAERVCADVRIPSSEILDLISSLVNKSLVVADFREGRPRYRFLETMNAYAVEKLVESGEQDRLASRRASWIADFSDRAHSGLWEGGQSDWTAQAIYEIENVRASLKWALGPSGDIVIAGQIAGGLTFLWQARALGDGIRFVEQVLGRWQSGASPRTEALLWFALGSMSPAKRRAECAGRAAQLYEELRDDEGLARSLRIEAEGLRQMQSLDAAEKAVDRGLALLGRGEAKDREFYAGFLRTKAAILVDAGRSVEAREALDEVLQVLKPGVDDLGLTTAEILLAELEFAAGNIERALALSEECISTCLRLGDVSKQAWVTVNAAAYRLAAGDINGGESRAREALALGSEASVGLYVSLAIQHLGTVAALRGDTRRAAVLLAYSDHRLAAQGFEREFTEQASRDLGMKIVQDSLTCRDLSLIRLRAFRLSEPEAINEARRL